MRHAAWVSAGIQPGSMRCGGRRRTMRATAAHLAERVADLLVEYQPAGLPAGKIGEMLELPGATLSFHLNQLKQAGLITSIREGRSLIYSANTAAVDELAQYLQEDCCSKSLDG